MPDTIAPPAPAAPSAAPAQPPAPPAAPAPASTGYSVDPEVTKKATEALGDFHMVQPPPLPDDTQPAGTQPPAPPAAPNGPQSDAATSAPGAEGAQTQQTPALPGEDYLKELEQAGLLVGEQKPAPVQQAQPLPTSDEEIAKAINPDGKQTVEQQLKNAQSFIGKQGRELGQKVKVYEQQIAQLTQGASEFAKRFKPDPNVPGGLRATGNTVLEFADTVPQAELEQALASRGVKLVPINAELKSGEDPAERAWMETYINKAMPGTDKSYEEKIAEIRADPDLNEKRLSDFNAWRLARRAQTEQVRMQQENELRVQRQDAMRTVDGFWAAISKHPDYATVLKPEIMKWNALMGPYEDAQGRPLPGAIPLKTRLQVLRTVAEVARFPKVLREAVAKAREMGRTEAATLREGVGAIPGAGEQPDVSAQNVGQPGQGKNGEVYTKEEMAEHRKSFGLGYS